MFNVYKVELDKSFYTPEIMTECIEKKISSKLEGQSINFIISRNFGQNKTYHFIVKQDDQNTILCTLDEEVQISPYINIVITQDGLYIGLKQ